MRRPRRSSPNGDPEEERVMLWTITLLLGILWLLGFSFQVGGGLVHLLLVVALVVVVVNVFSGRRLT
jgi:hypothetical protein